MGGAQVFRCADRWYRWIVGLVDLEGVGCGGWVVRMWLSQIMGTVVGVDGAGVSSAVSVG